MSFPSTKAEQDNNKKRRRICNKNLRLYNHKER